MILFEAFGIMAVSDLPGVASVMNLNRDQRDAALMAMQRLRERKNEPALIAISKHQVLAVPDLSADMFDNCVVVDVRSSNFRNRKLR